MAYQAVPKTELEYLLDVERALGDVVSAPESMPPAPSEQQAQLVHALGALRRAGFSKARAARFVRSLRAIGIQKPGRFVVGLRSDYAKANYRRSGSSQSPYLAEDEFEAVGLLLQTILFHRPDVARRELSIAAAALADSWLEAAGFAMPSEAPSTLHIETFHAGVTASECAAGLRELVAWARMHPPALEPDKPLSIRSHAEDATPGLPNDLAVEEKTTPPPVESVDPE
jgi:hypothetical protein